MEKELGDRIYPESMGQLGRLNLRMHLARYDFALSLLTIGGKTLDAGCGAGYGSRILSWLAHEVVAVDKSNHAIEYALKYNSHPRIQYREDILASVNETDFDNVVCFEVLEHQTDSEGLLKHLMGRLKVGGRGFFSVPINSGAPGHLRIFTYDQACNLFKGYVGKLHYQRGVVINEREGNDVDIVLANLIKDR